MIAALILASLIAQGTTPETPLEAGFKSPPASARPHTWWHWMAGNVTKEGIRADLEAMNEAGIGGAHIFDAGQGIPPGPIAYNSPEWRDLMAYAMAEAQRLGLEMAMHNCSGWSSSGGPWVQPDDAMKKTTWSTADFVGPGTPPMPPEPPTVLGYYREVALYAFPTPAPTDPKSQEVRGSLIGLAPGIEPPKSLDWPVVDPSKLVQIRSSDQLPAGNWTILRFGYTLTGARNVASRPSGEGLEVDKLSAGSLDRYMEGCLVPLFQRIGDPVGKAFTTVLIDSYETGFQNWTPTILDDFKRLRGYDPTPFLPALAGIAVKDDETTQRFLFDYRRTIADLWSENYSGHFAQRLKDYGLKLAVEPYGNGSFDPFTYAKPAGLIMGEYWVGEGQINGSVKHAASVAHVYGHSVVGAEALTASPGQAGWSNEPRQWKPFADRGYAMGINRIIYHRMAHQPWLSGVLPGMTMGPWGSHVDRTQTFWSSHMPSWDTYLARCQFMLQSGLFVADVCQFTGEGSPQEYAGEGYSLPDIPKGYDFDFCGLDPFMSLSVANGRVVLPNGASYRVLALPNTDRLTLAVVRKLQNLVESGAIVIGPKPLKSPSLADRPDGDREILQIANQLWGFGASGVKSTGRGRVFWGKTVAQVLASLRVEPDFASEAKGVLSLHRQIASSDGKGGRVESYFVASSIPFPRTVTCSFRVSGLVPEFWQPETGLIEDAPVWRTTRTGTQVDIPFDADGSVFVVFRRSANRVRHVIGVGANPVDQAAPREKTLTILKAEYGDLAVPSHVSDVTSVLRGAVVRGSLRIGATNGDMGGDPAYNIVKSLRVRYVYDGQEKTVTIPENETLAIGDVPNQGSPPEFEVLARPGAPAELRAWQDGSYQVRMSAGGKKEYRVADLPSLQEVSGPWEVRFAPGWDAPASTQFDRLASWSDNDDFGIHYYSGTATYKKELVVPDYARSLGVTPEDFAKSYRIILDLGDVREMCRVRLNGKLIATLWKPPFRVDISGVEPGSNQLEIEVTNLWVNRLIGDEQFPDDMGWNGAMLKGWPEWFVKQLPRPEPRRKTFTTWRRNTKDTPLMPSGLLGPVVLRPIKVIEIR